MLSALAQFAKSDKEEGPAEKPASSSSAPAAVDESVLEKAMDEFRAAPDSKAALRSFRALLASVR